MRLFMHGDSGCGGFVIAADDDDALALLVETVGIEDAAEQLGDGWEEWLPESELEICDVDEPGQPKEKRLVSQWIAEVGRGYWFGWA